MSTISISSSSLTTRINQNNTIIVTILDSNNTGISGETVTLTDNNNITYQNPTDNSNGTYTFTVTSTTAVVLTYIAHDGDLTSNPVSVAYTTITPISIIIDTPVSFLDVSFSISQEIKNGLNVPLRIPGLQGWYDATDTAYIINNANDVSIWQDKSGNNNHATVNDLENRPVLQSNGSIYFDGSSQYFNLPNNALPFNNSSYTIISVFTSVVSGGIITGGNGNWSVTGGVNSLDVIDGSNKVSSIWSSNNIQSSMTYNSGPNIVYTDYLSGSNRNLILNIQNVNTDQPNTRVQPNTNNTIGYSTANGYLEGYLNEILIFNRVLTTEQKQLVEGYLSWKWSITGYLPWSHPYKFKQPSMIPEYVNDPLSYNDIVSWYDLSDFDSVNISSGNYTVDTIYDKNNNTNDLNIPSNTLPKFVFNQGLLLDGTTYLMNDSFVQNLDEFTIYIVFDQTTSTNNAGIIGFISNTNNDASVGGLSFNTGVSPNNFKVLNTNINITPTNTNNNTNIYAITCKTNIINVYYNGVLNGTQTITSTNGSSTQFILGSRFINNSPTNGLIGYIKEVIIYSKLQLTGIRQELEGYLAWKWTLQNNLPGNHPYKYIPYGVTNKILSPINLNSNNLPHIWLDGNDLSTINNLTWKDKSSNRDDMTYTGTSINIDSTKIPNMNSIRFTGDGKYFINNYAINVSNYSIASVFFMDSDVITKGRILSYTNTGTNDYDNISSIGIGHYATNQICLYYNDTNSTPITLISNSFNMIIYILDGPTDNLYGYLNGTLVSTNNLNITINTTKLNIGNDGNSQGYTWKGYINEVVLYPNSLRSSDRQILEGYLAWKWQINSLLPNNHPYYNLLPIITTPSFQPTNIQGLDIWNDAYSLINLNDGDTIPIWYNSNTNSTIQGNCNETNPIFSRFGFNGQPTVTYSPTSYTVLQNTINQNTYDTQNWTFMGISRYTNGQRGRVFSSYGNTLIIGYYDNNKNVLYLGFQWLYYVGSEFTYTPGDTKWDNYVWAKNSDSTPYKFSNYDLNLNPSNTNTNRRLIGLSYNYEEPSDCQISEVLVYSQGLPLYYIQKLQGYLVWKWGLQFNLSTNHPYKYTPPDKDETVFTLKLIGWKSNIPINTLYILDTISGNLLTSTTNFYGNDFIGYFSIFAYRFINSQNYLTISDTDDMSGIFNYEIPTPLIVNPLLTLKVTAVDNVNNWAYSNVAKTFSFNLSSYYEGYTVNYTDYYSNIYVYYSSDNNYTNLISTNITNITLINNVITFTVSFNPTIITSPIYFYFGSNSNVTLLNILNSAISTVYVFFNRASLTCELDHYPYFNNFVAYTNLPSQLNFSGNSILFIYYSKNDPTYSNNVYANQTYGTNIVSGSYGGGGFTITFPLPDTGKYYLTLSNKPNGSTRTINDININIALPITANLINFGLNKFYGFYELNSYVATIGTYNGGVYPFTNVRIFYSTRVPISDQDLTELQGSPFTIQVNNSIKTCNFYFNNTILQLPSVYFNFTSNEAQVPPLSTFTTSSLISCYNKSTLTFTLDHYNNNSIEFILTANNWSTSLNAMSPLKLYILDNNNISIGYPIISVPISQNNGIFSGIFYFDFNVLDTGTYKLCVTNTDLDSLEINYIIPTPISVNLIIPHFIIKNSQYTNTQTTPSNGFLISQIPGVKLWLDSSDISTIVKTGNAITRWNDKSGNANNFNVVNGSPTYVDSTSGILINVGDTMASTNIITFNQTTAIFYVAKLANTTGNQYILSTSAGVEYSIRYILTTLGGGNTVNDMSNSYTVNGVPNGSANYTQYHLVDCLVNGANYDIFYIPSFNGNINELLIFNFLTPSQIQLVEGYLAWKWNLNAQLPANHPFYNINPIISQPIITQKFLPSQIPNNVLWLDAQDISTVIISSGNITQWNDKSGSGKNAIGVNSPTYGTDNGILFDGTNSFTLPNGTLPVGDSSYSYFIVADIDSYSTSSLISGGNNATTNSGILITANGFNISTDWTNNELISNYEFTPNTRFLIESFYTSGGQRSMYFNSNFDDSDTPGVARTQTNNNNLIGDTFVGEIYEIIVYSRNLNQYQRQQIEGYLMQKWAIPILNILPSDITSLAVWLDATDPIADGTILDTNTPINTWYDKSGNDNNFTYFNARPRYKNNLFGNLPGLDFSNQAGFTSSAFPYTIDLTIAVIVNVQSIQDNIYTWGNLFYHGNKDVNFSLRRYGGYAIIELEASGTHNLVEDQKYWLQNETLLFYGTITAGTNVDFNMISSSLSFNLKSVVPQNLNNNGTYTAFVGTSETNEASNAYIGEVVYYNKVLSENELNKLLSYLTSKWKLPYEGSYIHPYASLPPPILYRTLQPVVPQFFNPTQFGNLALWLDGADLSSVTLSGLNITQWNDKSGNSNNATAVNTPQWLPTYGVSFNGTSHFTLPNGTLPIGDSSYSYYIVASFANTTSINGLIVGGTGSLNQMSSIKGTNNKIKLSWYENDLTSDYSFTINQPIIIGSIYQSGGKRQLYINGNLDISDTPGTRNQSNTGNKVGCSASSNEFMNGVIYEIIVYNSLLTNSQNAQIGSYLNNKWIKSVNPNLIPNLFNWIDAADITTLFQNIEGTTPVTATTQTINYIKDKSNNSYDLNSTGWEGPTYTTLNSLPAIRFIGNNNLLTLTQVPKSDNVTVFWVGSLIGFNTAVWGHYSDTNVGSEDVILRKYEHAYQVNFGSYDTNSCIINIPLNVPLIIWATMENGTNMVINAIHSNGQIVSNFYIKQIKQWQPGNANIYLNSVDASNYYSSSLLSENLYYQRVLSLIEINQILTYLGNKWNIPIPYKNDQSNLDIDVVYSNQIITLTLSTYYPQVYLYYGLTDKSYGNLVQINSPITSNNAYVINPSTLSITINIYDMIDIPKKIIYFYAFTDSNYTGVSGRSLPFSFIDQSKINLTLNHYDISSNVYTVTLTNFDPLLINQTLNLFAIKNDSGYENINQTLTISNVSPGYTTYTGTFTYSFPPYNIYTLLLTNSYNGSNIPNGNICIQSPKNIYTFTLNSTLITANTFTGSNNITLQFAIPGLSNNLSVSNLIPSVNISIDNIPFKTNPQKLLINQININLYKYQNNGFTLWLDAMDSSTITHNNNRISEWSDKSGLTNNGTQDDITYKPVYEPNTNGILFKGYAYEVPQQFLNLPFVTFNNTNYYTCSFVYTYNGGESYVISKVSEGVNLYATILLFGSGQSVRWTPQSGQYYDKYFGDFEISKRYLLTFTYDGIRYRLWRNGELVQTVNTTEGIIPDDLAVTSCKLGSGNDSSVNIKIHEFIFNETYLYDHEIQKIEAYLGSKWNISVTNPYTDNIVSFSPNSNLINNQITFSTIDSVITGNQSITQLLINPVLTLNNARSATHYIIDLDNWNSNITNVFLFVGTNIKYYNRSLLISATVSNDVNGYYIIVNYDWTSMAPNTYYLSVRNVNSNTFDFDLRVSDPNEYLTIE